MSDPLFDLEGRVAIVTGAMGQLGQVYLAGLAERGVLVASFDVDDGAVPDGARAFTVDVTDRSSIQRGARDVVAEWGVPHVLINNAALDAPPDAPAEEVGPFEDYPEASFDAVMDVNVKGTFLCCQVVGAAMAREGRGSIVNVSSVYGLLSPVQELYEFRRAAWRDVRQARRVLGLEVRGPQPHALSRDVLGDVGRPRQHADARGRVERPAEQEFLDAWAERIPDGPHARRARGARGRRVPRLRRVVVRDRV